MNCAVGGAGYYGEATQLHRLPSRPMNYWPAALLKAVVKGIFSFWEETMENNFCMDCEQLINLDDFPTFVHPKNPKRCADCTALALWEFVIDSRSKFDFEDIAKGENQMDELQRAIRLQHRYRDALMEVRDMLDVLGINAQTPWPIKSAYETAKRALYPATPTPEDN